MVLNIKTDRRCTLRHLLLLALIVLVNGLKSLIQLQFVEADPLIALFELTSQQKPQEQQEQLLFLKQQSQGRNLFNPFVGFPADESLFEPSLHNTRLFRKGIQPAGRTIDEQQQQSVPFKRSYIEFGRLETRSLVQKSPPAATATASTSTYYSNYSANNMGATTTQAVAKIQAATTIPVVVAATTTTKTADESNGSSSLRKALLGLQNPRLLGGDIIMRTRRKRKDRLIKFERSALVSSIDLWPSGVIFYELDSSVSHLTDLIWKVMQQFHDETCIKFIPRKHNEPDYLRIEALKGCFSYIGRIGGEQTLSLGDGCEYRGTIAHELLHAVGFYHHQNRSDRDDFLEILWDNIARGKEGQFLKMNPQDNVLLNEFDYDSIMLYGPRTFGKTIDKETMKPKREGVILLEVVEKQGLSLLDVDSVNKLYKCKTFNG